MMKCTFNFTDETIDLLLNFNYLESPKKIQPVNLYVNKGLHPVYVVHNKSVFHSKKRAPMIRYRSQKQLPLVDFE
jgi:hypothetical protein